MACLYCFSSCHVTRSSIQFPVLVRRSFKSRLPGWGRSAGVSKLPHQPLRHVLTSNAAMEHVAVILEGLMLTYVQVKWCVVIFLELGILVTKQQACACAQPTSPCPRSTQLHTVYHGHHHKKF